MYNKRKFIQHTSSFIDKKLDPARWSLRLRLIVRTHDTRSQAGTPRQSFTKIREPFINSSFSVPVQPIQIIMQGMKFAVIGAKFHGLMNCIVAKPGKPSKLQPLLNAINLCVGNRAALEI